MKRVVINKGETFGTLDRAILKNDELRTLVNKHLKQGTAQLVIDNDDTQMYRLFDSLEERCSV